MSKTLKWILAIITILILMGGVFSGGILVGWLVIPDENNNEATQILQEQLVTTPSAINDVQEESTEDETETQKPENDPLEEAEVTPLSPSEFSDVFNVLKEAWQLVHELYVNQPIDDEILLQGAIDGMMDALGDKHSSYLDPNDFQQLNMQQDGSYEGIGAWVDTSGDYITIINPMEGSPAENAGVKPGDLIIAIDGVDLSDTDPSAALQMILGPAGTEVILTVEREGEEDPIDIAITRSKITVPSVEYEMLDDDIAYIHLFSYGQETSEEFSDAIDQLKKENPKGLILDLRGNGGGYLYTAVNITSEFLESNQVILYEEAGNGDREIWSATPGGSAPDIPLVVLVDYTSASASEITAGAIQDYERGILVGTTTYGKGSVQNIIPLSENQGAVRITIAKWLTPDERLIHEVGLEPDIVVEFDVEAYETDGSDNQLEKAKEVLRDLFE
ncbi:MAG: S41 family peptidase [Anaerolineaceae bacterium]|nr:S41 family peptidase [Anaerolineaceae bacterium]